MLEKYKKGELAEEQMEQVEADLIYQMFRKQKEESLRNDLKKLAALAPDEDEDEDENERVQNTRMTVVHRSNNQRIWWAAAASVAVLAVASWWFFMKSKSAEAFDNQTLANMYIKSDAAPIWGRTMGGTAEEREEKAKEAYQNSDFNKAVPLFEAIPPSKKEHFLYLGVSALKQQKSDAQKAIENLLKARTIGNGWEEDVINWYLVLAYLQSGKTDEARKELNNIIKIGRDNVSRAEEILKKIPNK